MYITWLNNAYAMEIDIAKSLEGQVNDFEDYLEVQKGIEWHLEQTKTHAERVKMCIENNGGEVSEVKSTLAAMMGAVKGASMDIMHDKVVKILLANFSIEHMEIISYRALIVAAEQVGDTDAISVFEEILEDEETMAGEIETQLPAVIRAFLMTHDHEDEDEDDMYDEDVDKEEDY